MWLKPGTGGQQGAGVAAIVHSTKAKVLGACMYHNTTPYVLCATYPMLYNSRCGALTNIRTCEYGSAKDNCRGWRRGTIAMLGEREPASANMSDTYEYENNLLVSFRLCDFSRRSLMSDSVANILVLRAAKRFVVSFYHPC